MQNWRLLQLGTLKQLMFDFVSPKASTLGESPASCRFYRLTWSQGYNYIFKFIAKITICESLFLKNHHVQLYFLQADKIGQLIIYMKISRRMFDLIIGTLNMGCDYSRQEAGQLDKNNRSLRRNNKKADKIIGRYSENPTISENVVLDEEKISSKDQAKIVQIVASHFFFSSFSQTERTEIIEQMVIYKCTKDQYIFKQSDPGSLFFIIRKGKVAIEINGKYIKDMERGESFGELSLLYTAPRSASVKTLTDCTFWALHQTVFKRYTEQLVKKNYKIAKPFLQKVPLFQFLSTNQINSIAYAMNTLKYQPNGAIFKQGDDANSFYIVVEGQVNIIIRNKNPITLKKGQSFGENSFKKCEVRSGTAVAGPSGALLLSIGRSGLLKCLGNNIQELVEFNILKWALKRSKIFANIPNDLIKKFIQISEIKQCQDNEIICKSKEPLKYLLVSLDGKIDENETGVLVNEQYILETSNPDKQILLKSNIKKHGKGNVYMLPIKKIQGLLEINLIDATKKNADIFKDSAVERNQLAEKQKTKPKLNLSLNDLLFEKSLGEGQFGRVYLVRAKNSRQLYALKIIKKKAIVELGLHQFVKNEKQILASTNHPLIVHLQQTFKDEAFLYLLMQYVDGIDFFDMLREIGLCNAEVSCFYMASLILCIQELHSRNIVYRDLKPENAVIDSKGFLYMIDLGTAKKLNEQKGNRTFTIIGTPHYMAPEIIQGKGYGLQVDIWSLGVILYEMVCGRLPFGEQIEDPYMVHQKIMKQKVQYPNYYYSKKGKNLIQKLLERNSLKRQIEDFSVLKRDPYFEQFKWDQLYNKTMRPPVAPKKKKDSNTKQSDTTILKYLAKDIKAEAVKEPTPWDIIF